MDSVYGSGPSDEPFQYELDGVRLLITPNDLGFAELPRNVHGTALIGDPRNDVNSMVSQLHLAFLKLHNRFVAQVQASGQTTTPSEQFIEAQRRTRWHYQWVLVHDYLPRIIGQDLFARLYVTSTGQPPEIQTRYYRPRVSAYMPVEFSAAAFRFGHSQVRDRYSLNEQVERPLFAPGDAAGTLADLRSQVVPTTWEIDWTRFFVIGGSTPQFSQRIDATVAAALFDLPNSTADDRSLPLRNLLRGQRMLLPSGQSVAKHLGLQPLRPDELQLPNGTAIPDPTPLWLYILQESSKRADGRSLGPVGGRIVGEILLGLLEQDPTSYYGVDRSWKPDTSIPATGLNGLLTVGDLVQFAQT